MAVSNRELGLDADVDSAGVFSVIVILVDQHVLCGLRSWREGVVTLQDAASRTGAGGVIELFESLDFLEVLEATSDSLEHDILQHIIGAPAGLMETWLG